MSALTAPVQEADLAPEGTQQPFTLAMAEDLGLTQRQIYGPWFRSVLHGVFIDRRIPDSLVVRSRAGLLIAPVGGVLSHHTAARLWAPTGPRSSQIHISYARAAHVRRHEISVHRFRYPMERAWRHGLPVTTPGMTFMHLAVHLDLVQLVTFGDRLVKRAVVTVEQLNGYANAWSHHGGTLGRRAAVLVRDRSESAPESHLRLLLVLAGLPEPAVNHPITAADGTVIYRLDLAYVDLMIAIEYDGRWHDDPEQQVKDAARRARLQRDGWRFVIVRAEGLYESPELTLADVCAALTERGASLSDLRLNEEYRRFFGAGIID